MVKPFSGLDLKVCEIGWAAYLTRKWNRWRHGNARALSSLPGGDFCARKSSKKKFGAPLRRAKRGPRLHIPDAPDASSQMVTARRVVPGRDGFRSCCGDATLRLSTRSKRLRRAKNVGASRFECPLVAVNGSRTGPRDQGSRAFGVFRESVCRDQRSEIRDQRSEISCVSFD
ncbi:MAG: hypothetical protein QOC81_3377 [Thermoanaerobaculia bacterium]|jgi:hypothetical protein|nr:hypothetical protein [Thermoanaerobaculia bacterium]